MTESISSLLESKQHLMVRRNQLNAIIGENSKRIYWEEKSKVEEPVYDIKLVDSMVTEINNAILHISKKIKQVNSEVKVEIDIDFNHLMRPIV